VVGQPDIELAASDTLSRRLGMTFQAEIGVSLHEQFGIDRTMRLVTNSAALAHRAMLEDHWSALLGVATGAGLVYAGHRQPAGGFEDITAMRVVTLHAIHFVLRDRVMLREAELRLGGAMALKTRRRILSGVENEFAPAPAARHVQAARPVTRFAPGLTQTPCVCQVNPGMGTGGKHPHDIGVAIHAALITHERGSRNRWRSGQYRRRGGAGIQQQKHREH
jgi:hypothetical protein